MWIQDYIKNASSYGGDIDHLYMVITFLIGFWLLLTYVVMFYFIFRFKAKDGQKAAYIGGDKRSQLLWIFVPLIFIVACDLYIDVATTSVWKKIKQDLPPADAKIRIIAQQW